MNDRVSLAFHVVGCLVILRSICLLSQQQSVRGVSLWQALFFATWSCWNLFFYDSLGLIWSWYGAVIMAILNVSWVMMLCYYRYQEWCSDWEKWSEEQVYSDVYYRVNVPNEYPNKDGDD